MLKDRLDGTETKEEIVEYLQACKCPTLKRMLAGEVVAKASIGKTVLPPAVAQLSRAQFAEMAAFEALMMTEEEAEERREEEYTAASRPARVDARRKK